MNRKWTKEMEAFIIVKRSMKVPYKKLLIIFNKKFKTDASLSDLHQKAFKLGITKPTAPKPYRKKKTLPVKSPVVVKKTKKVVTGKYSKKEIKILLNCKSVEEAKNSGLNRKESSLVQKYYSLKRGNTKKTTKKKSTVTKTNKKLNSDSSILFTEKGLDWRDEPATRRQLRYLLSLTNANLDYQERKEMVKVLFGKTTKKEACDGIEAALSVLDKQELNLLDKAEEIEEYLKPQQSVSMAAETMWTKEEDFDILCNFYEYSIDEARNRFNCPYMVIASRLETLIDSTEPDHIEMLMEATKTIKARKALAAREAKTGFWKRRKLRKQAKKAAKKQAKLDREIAKVEKKLNKLKGE